MNKQIPISSRERIRRGLKSFIDRRVRSHVSAFHTGIITQYTSGSSITVRLTDIEDTIEISWDTQLLSAIRGLQIQVNNRVLLAYHSGRFIIIGVLSDNVPTRTIP